MPSIRFQLGRCPRSS